MDLNDSDILSTWKEIAQYLTKDVRTAKRWEKNLGLPVYRIKGLQKSDVFARKSEIDLWHKEIFQTKNEIKTIVKNKRNFSIYYIIFPGIVLILLGLYLFFSLKKNIQPVDFKIHRSVLSIIDNKGEELWNFDTGFVGLFNEEKYRTQFQNKKTVDGVVKHPILIIDDINSDGMNEVLFAVNTYNQMHGEKVYYFNHKRKQLWARSTGRGLKYGKDDYSNDFLIHGFHVHEFEKDGGNRIVVISDQQPNYPTQLVLFDLDGNVEGEYWNSGRILDIEFKDLNSDGRDEILFSGINNEYKKGFLAALDITNMRGCSPCVFDKYKCDELETGSEIFYILLPRDDISVLKDDLGSASILNIPDNGNITVMTQYSKIIYKFDNNMILLNIEPNNDFEFDHKMFKKEGKISSTLNDNYLQNLGEKILYWNGKEWTNSVSMSNPIK